MKPKTIVHAYYQQMLGKFENGHIFWKMAQSSVASGSSISKTVNNVFRAWWFNTTTPPNNLPLFNLQNLIFSLPQLTKTPSSTGLLLMLKTLKSLT